MSTIAPNPMPELAPLLKRLRLSGILDSLETRNREAVANKIPYTDFLASTRSRLATVRPSPTRSPIPTSSPAHRRRNRPARAQEVQPAHPPRGGSAPPRRSSSSTSTSMSPSTKPSSPSWPPAASSPRKSRSSSLDLAAPESPTSHKPSATPPCAPTTMCCSPPRVSCWQPSMPRAPSTLTSDASTPLPACRCSVIDDFGLKPLRAPQDEDFHDLVAERYEQGATIISSNLDFPEWGDAFPNRLLGAATLDRLRHGAYRLHHGRNAKLLFSASLMLDASSAGLYLHPKHRRRRLSPPIMSSKE